MYRVYRTMVQKNKDESFDMPNNICVFCNNPILSGNKAPEHIFPRWLQDHLNLKKIYFYQTLYNQPGTLIEDKRYLSFNGHVSGNVCKKCNTGWLSDIENGAKEKLILLFDGKEDIKLSLAESKNLSLWMFKTALTLHSASIQKRFIPDLHYKSFYRNLSIPEDVWIHISPVKTSDAQDLSWIQNGGWRGVNSKVQNQDFLDMIKMCYKVSLRVGWLAWRIAYLPNVNFFDFDNDTVKNIYPRNYELIWKPSLHLDSLKELDSSLILSVNRQQVNPSSMFPN